MNPVQRWGDTPFSRALNHTAILALIPGTMEFMMAQMNSLNEKVARLSAAPRMVIPECPVLEKRIHWILNSVLTPGVLHSDGPPSPHLPVRQRPSPLWGLQS